MSAAHVPLRIEPFKVACSNCNLREICLPLGMSAEQLERLLALTERYCVVLQSLRTPVPTEAKITAAR